MSSHLTLPNSHTQGPRCPHFPGKQVEAHKGLLPAGADLGSIPRMCVALKPKDEVTPVGGLSYHVQKAIMGSSRLLPHCLDCGLSLP